MGNISAPFLYLKADKWGKKETGIFGQMFNWVIVCDKHDMCETSAVVNTGQTDGSSTPAAAAVVIL